MDKKSFVYYFDWAEQLLQMPDDLRLKIDDAIKRFVLYGEEPTDREVLYSMFSLMRTQILRDKEKWEDRCEKSRNSVNMRWAKHREEEENDTNVYERIPSNTNVYERIPTIRTNTNDTDNDNDNVNVDDIKERTKVPKKKISLPIDQRKENFLNELRQFSGDYPSTTLNAFYAYWTEMTPDKKKMRFEKEKTWETKKRLARWAKNNND